MTRLIPAAALCLAHLIIAAPAAAEVPGDPAAIKPLAVGDAAPAVEVRRPDGQPFTLDPSQLTAPTILVFYRGGWCPYCNAHLGELARVGDDLKALGYAMYFLSADRPEILYSSLKDPDTPFVLLSDARMSAARAFGIAFRVDDLTYLRYRSMGLDLEAAAGETHHELPVPAVFILDQGGIIRFVHANPDYKLRLAAAPLLEVAQRVAANASP
jgi:peroxiredoxin